jgi:hypothetical protein
VRLVVGSKVVASLPPRAYTCHLLIVDHCRSVAGFGRFGVLSEYVTYSKRSLSKCLVGGAIAHTDLFSPSPLVEFIIPPYQYSKLSYCENSAAVSHTALYWCSS